MEGYCCFVFLWLLLFFFVFFLAAVSTRAWESNHNNYIYSTVTACSCMHRSSSAIYIAVAAGVVAILICIYEIYIFIEFYTPLFGGACAVPVYLPYVPVPVAAPHLTSKKAPLCVSPRERMPGYGATAVDKKLGLVCPHCKLLLRSAVQTDEGVRLCESCFKEIAR